MSTGRSEPLGGADGGRDLACATCPYRGAGHCLDPCGLRNRLRVVPPTAIPLLRSVAAEVVDQITTHIQQEIAAYAGPAHGRRRGLILDAVGRAAADFVSLACGTVGDHPAVDELFRRMGAGLVLEGGRPASLLGALQLAAGDVLRAIEEAVRQHALPGEVVAVVARALNDYLRHLSEQVEHGYLGARAVRRSPRAQLARAVLHGEPVEAIDRLARAASWPPPGRILVLVADLRGRLARPELLRCGPRILVQEEQRSLVAVAPEGARGAAQEALARATGGAVVAVTWPVPLEEAPHALRWARRALRLQRDGRIPRDLRVIDCAEFPLLLWLEADPRLVEHVSVEWLAPLQNEKPHQRLVLAETLLRWLETDESAPDLARHLGAHAQTVRNRQRRLQTLFGDRLEIPQDRLALLLAISSALPQWRAEGRRRLSTRRA